MLSVRAGTPSPDLLEFAFQYREMQYATREILFG